MGCIQVYVCFVCKGESCIVLYQLTWLFKKSCYSITWDSSVGKMNAKEKQERQEVYWNVSVYNVNETGDVGSYFS